MNKSMRYAIGLLSVLMLAMTILLVPSAVQGGNYDASNEVTYKEYWIHHDEYTNNGCASQGRSIEPSGGLSGAKSCTATLEFEIPDDFSNAIKAEVYLDLWRNRDSKESHFSLNGGQTHHPNVGSDWSRTPWVGEVQLSDLVQGTNEVLFWGNKQHKIYDVAIRIYYDGGNPLVAGPGSDTTAPDGSLTGIEDDGGVKLPGAGGTLMVDGDELELTASVDGDTAYVEFHAWYEGYDEDNDGEFRDWHNVNRNNWCPGGKDVAGNPQGATATTCTIDHAGTVKPNGGTATLEWDISHIPNQGKMKFKVRLVDADGNVRDAAGGESADFKLMRTKPVTAFVIHGFEDEGLHMEGQKPDSVDYNFDMPSNIEDFDQAYLLGAYWRNPRFSLNQTNASFANPGDEWELAIKDFNSNLLDPGRNRITYSWANGPGAFIEKPGPMFVMRETGNGADNQPPYLVGQVPEPGAVDASYLAPVKAQVEDQGFGVDITTISMSVDGNDVSNSIQINGVLGNYELVYNHGGLDQDKTIQVVVEACDLKNNCSGPMNYSFTTAPPDTTAPIISNVSVTPRPDGGVVSWTTDEPADSKVDFGATNSYGDDVYDAALKTSHQLIISGMPAESTVHYKITSEDQQGNDASTSNDTFETGAPAQIISDDFNACALDTAVWQFFNPNGGNYTMNGEQLEIFVPGGSAHAWNNKLPPRMMQFANNGDLSVEVKFDSQVSLATQMQGIVIEADPNNYMRVAYEYLANEKQQIIFTEFVENGVRIKGATKDLIPDLTAPLYLKVTRTGDTWEWFYRDGGQWKPANQTYDFDLSVLRAGVFAGNSGAAGAEPAHTAVVDYFFNSASPINPEDANSLTLDLTVVGEGMATKTPNKTEYDCGEEVGLSASTTSPGWEFGAWSGDLTSVNSNETITMTGPLAITANFEAIPLSLNVNVLPAAAGTAGNAVTKTPDMPTYVYDDVVQLTATTVPGWSFVQWGGALTGTELNKQILMQKSETVSATFEQDQYTLDLQVVHDGVGTGGTAVASPQKASYVYGETIDLTATVKPGWTFKGWSGAVTSTDLATTYNFTGNAAIVATFEQDQYDLNVTIDSDGVGVGGVVTKDPDQNTYLFGDTVTLEAVANPGWEFVEWSGDLSGTNSVQFVDMDDDKNITATFFQQTFGLTVQIQGPGNVNIVPNKNEFFYGEQVTLTAAASGNNSLCRWEGDLVGGENPVSFNFLDKDMNITAVFGSSAPPDVNALQDHDVLVGELVAFNVVSPGGGSLVVSAVDLPEGATFEDNGDGTGSFSWRPDVTQQGQYVVRFIVDDPATGCQGGASTEINVGGYGVLTPIVVGS